MQPYLTTSPVVATQSLEEAREAVAQVYLPHELVGPRDAMEMRLNAVTDRRLTVGYLTYQAETELRMPPVTDAYHVNLCIAGETAAQRADGGRHLTLAGRDGLVLSPVQSNTVRWTPEAEQLILKVPRASLEAHLSDLLGRPVSEVVDFGYGLDLTTGAGRTLLGAVRFLCTELDRPDGLAAMPRAREELEAFVLTSLLHAGVHQFTDALLGRERTRTLGRLAPVVDHIEAHADADLTPEVLARVGCVSVRTLHAAFQAQLGESPMSYVRRIRLARVRAELVAADAGDTRVTDVAMRWGFFHQSRFAQQYRERFGELPSETLAR